MSSSVLLITIVTACFTNTNWSVLSLPLWESRPLPVFMTEELRNEEQELMRSHWVQASRHSGTSHLTVLGEVQYLQAPAPAYPTLTSTPAVVSTEPQVRHLPNSVHRMLAGSEKPHITHSIYVLLLQPDMHLPPAMPPAGPMSHAPCSTRCSAVDCRGKEEAADEMVQWT